jgi:hypothetical protein
MDRSLEMIGPVGAIRAEVLREPPQSFDFFGRQLASDGVLAVERRGIRAIVVPRENGAGAAAVEELRPEAAAKTTFRKILPTRAKEGQSPLREKR